MKKTHKASEIPARITPAGHCERSEAISPTLAGMTSEEDSFASLAMTSGKNYTETVDPSVAFKKVHSELGFLTFELTYRCPNNCTHCNKVESADSEGEQARELTTAQITDLLDQAAELGVMGVKFTGGEPLIRPNFTEIYLHARRLGMSVDLFTSATLITPEIAAVFARVPPRSPLKVTIYGMSRESYTAVSRNPDGFDSAFRGIELLRANNVLFQTCLFLLPQNEAEEEQYKQWAQSLGISQAGTNRHLVLRTQRDSEKRNKRITTLRVTPEQLAKESVDIPPELNYTDLFLAAKSYRRTREIFTCGFGRGKSTIDPYGNLLGCIDVRHPDMMYNLRTGTLRDGILRFFEVIRHRETSNPLFLTRCVPCFLRGFCDNCAAIAWSENGAVDIPAQYFCDEAHNRAVLLGLICEGEKGWEVLDWQTRIAIWLKKPDWKPYQ